MSSLRDQQTTHRRPLALKGWLVNRGVSQSELARRTGFCAPHVFRFLNRRAPLSRDFGLAIAREFNLGLEECEVLMGPPAEWVPGWPPGRRDRQDPDAGVLVAV